MVAKAHAQLDESLHVVRSQTAALEAMQTLRRQVPSAGSRRGSPPPPAGLPQLLSSGPLSPTSLERATTKTAATPVLDSALPPSPSSGSSSGRSHRRLSQAHASRRVYLGMLNIRVTLEGSSWALFGCGLVADDTGVYVSSIKPQTQCQVCGLFQLGDKLIKLNGLSLVGWTLADLNPLLNGLQQGAEVNFCVSRPIRSSSPTQLAQANDVNSRGAPTQAPTIDPPDSAPPPFLSSATPHDKGDNKQQPLTAAHSSATIDAACIAGGTSSGLQRHQRSLPPLRGDSCAIMPLPTTSDAAQKQTPAQASLVVQAAAPVAFSPVPRLSVSATFPREPQAQQQQQQRHSADLTDDYTSLDLEDEVRSLFLFHVHTYIYVLYSM